MGLLTNITWFRVVFSIESKQLMLLVLVTWHNFLSAGKLKYDFRSIACLIAPGNSDDIIHVSDFGMRIKDLNHVPRIHSLWKERWPLFGKIRWMCNIAFKIMPVWCMRFISRSDMWSTLQNVDGWTVLENKVLLGEWPPSVLNLVFNRGSLARIYMQWVYRICRCGRIFNDMLCYKTSKTITPFNLWWRSPGCF